MRVNYESMETWRLATDRLRCSPKFFGYPRYDCIIFKADESGTLRFGRLKEIFVVQVAEKQYPIAFIEAFGLVAGPRPSVDKTLGLCRLRMNRRRENQHGTMFIHIESVVRGALIVRDHGSIGSVYEDYLVVDIIDSDMFLRCLKYFPRWYE